MTSCDGVVTIPHPIVDGIAQGLCSFLNKECSYKPLEIINHCKKKLPEYMVPNKILYLDDFPYNSNGKVDRNKLRDLIENK
jgi:acyl-CoA synthetase (AMP-forming)/AMP-acid ligase II